MSNGSTTWRYTYDANGMRTSRSNGSTTYSYVYNGSQLTQMTKGSDTLYFTYGAIGPTTVTWNGTTYYYAVNGQGDVMGIFDGSGNCVVTYNWDNAWGYNPEPEGSLASTLGTLNPLRYRSYVYDEETGLYYLQSRYYDPEICRFINADEFTSTGQGFLGNNMYAYCLNNPASLSDSTGKFALSAFLGAVVGGAIGGALISTVSHIVNCAINGQELTASGLANAALTGAVTGAIGGAIGTIAFASSAATLAVKGIASAAVGLGFGVKTGLETEGTASKKWATGISTGVITAGSTFLGSTINAYDDSLGFVENAFANYATTLFVGAPAEIVSVGVQVGINSCGKTRHPLHPSYSSGPSGISNRNTLFVKALTY